MISTKQRATLRAFANKLTPCMQIGKDGIKDTTFLELENLFEARELIKINILQNCDYSPKEIAQLLQENIGCEIILVVGRKIVVYRKSTKDNFNHILEE